MRPPSSTGDGHGRDITALEYFTGREALLQAFDRYLNAEEGEALGILVLCGLPGIGKTALLRQLTEKLHDTWPPVSHAHINLENIGPSGEAYREVLLRLRSHLENLQTESVDFPHFDLCWAMMAARDGGDVPAFVHANRALYDLFQFAVSVVQAPHEGLEAFIEETTTKLPPLKRGLRRAGGVKQVLELRERALSDDETLPAELIKRFAQNLIENLPQSEGKACRAVLFMDNYEMLWPGSETGTLALTRQLDWWVRELAAYCLFSGIMLIVSGREPLKWAEDDSDWQPDEAHQKLLDQHWLDGFPLREAQTYLAKCGIGPTPQQAPSSLQQAIINCCNAGTENAPSCHPLPLALCAETVLRTRQARGSDPRPGTFKISREKADYKLTDGLLNSLQDRRLEEWLIRLSLTPRFDKQAAQALLNRLAPGTGGGDWEELKRLCFVEPQPDGFYRLHQAMREVLRARLNKRETPADHAWFVGYWTERKEPTLAWFHRWAADPAARLQQWVAQHSTLLQESRIFEARALLAQWADVALDDADRLLIGDDLWGRTHEALGDALRETPTSPRGIGLVLALGHYISALHVFTHTAFPVEWTKLYQKLGHLCVALPTGNRQENLQQAVAYFRAVLRVYTQPPFDTAQGSGIRLRQTLQVHAKNRSPKEWAGMLWALGQVYRELPSGDPEKDLPQAISCFEAALQVYTESLFPAEWAATQRSLGLAHHQRAQGHMPQHLRQATVCFHAALRVYTETDFPVEWAATQADLGNSCLELRGDDRRDILRQAVAAYQAALRIYTDARFPAERAATLFNLGQAFAEMGDQATDARAFRAARDCFVAASSGFARTGADADAVKAAELVTQIDAWLEGQQYK